MATVLASGNWRGGVATEGGHFHPHPTSHSNDDPPAIAPTREHQEFTVGQFVNVQPRTWAGYVLLLRSRPPGLNGRAFLGTSGFLTSHALVVFPDSFFL